MAMFKEEAEIKKLWGIIGTSNSSVLELRAIWPSGIEPSRPPVTKHFRVFEFSGVSACKLSFEKEALQLNKAGYNIYVVMNPIKPDFVGCAATDDDISFREILLIDIDRVEKKKEPATDAEVEDAKKLADEVEQYLSGHKWPEPIRVMSGNGHHLYYVLPEISNDEESRKCFQVLLNSLAIEFDNEVVKIDTTVFNASRITKVVGTIARKGLKSTERPYRMARVL